MNPTVMPHEDDNLKIDTSLLPSDSVVFKNCRLCISGSLTTKNSALIISKSTGRIVDVLYKKATQFLGEGEAEILDLNNKIVAPGFLELQTNGMRGFHFTHFEDAESYVEKIDEVARYLPSAGVTGFWVTIPTVASSEFKKILPSLAPREIVNGASLLGAHTEGPYLHPSKKGAHNSALFHLPSTSSIEVYGDVAKNNENLKLVTIAPELSGSIDLISDLVAKDVRVSLGHSSASYQYGLEAVKAGATCLTHTLNAMAPLHHRDPGLAGLVTAAPSTTPESPSFSIIPDGNHLHPSVATLLFRSNPKKCILITDSIELAGMPDGTYPGHSQVSSNQTKIGTRCVIEGTETLIGSCATLDQCLRNMVKWSGCSVAEAISCVTENIANFMGEVKRGKLEKGRKADLVVLGEGGEVVETWIGGRKVWEK